MKNQYLTATLLKYLAATTLLLGMAAHTAAQYIVDEYGHQLYIIYLDEHLVEQVDASGQEPMQATSDPRNAEDWRGWHRATTRAVVAQIEEDYGIEAVTISSHTLMTFSAYLSLEAMSELNANIYVTRIASAIGVAGAPSAPVTIPASVKAYEPFALNIIKRRYDQDDGSLMAINVSGSVITIEHQPDDILEGLRPLRQMTVHIPGLPAGDYTVVNKELSSAGSDRQRISLSTRFTVEAAPPTQPVYALYRSSKHYFITASEEEKEQIRNRAFPVDVGFNAWPADGPAPASALPVCRFYSSLVNSHFYTADTEECEFLQRDGSAWVYEGIAFQALVPSAGGTCMQGTDPVWRLYNNRFEQLDTNHRFVTSLGIYHSMIGEGWIGEGVAFCSPPPSE